MKGQDLLLKALPAVYQQFPGATCLFAGRVGSDAGLDDTVRFHRDLVSDAASLGLGSSVTFLGEVQDLPALLAKADVYVQPSRTESFGRVVCESLLAGTPVVAFDVGGIPEAAGPGALLVPPGDVAALSQSIIRVLLNKELAGELTARGGQYVKSNFEAADVAGRFLKEIVETSRATQFQETPVWIQS
jgi:glycosyltransferase involved in cell wall biosynthesis